MNLRPELTPDARAEERQGRWHLEIPGGPAGKYRVAQIDDYAALPRSRFPWRPPLILRLRARASAPDLPGTWGFGFWNDLSFGLGGLALRAPTLLNTAWFFFASPDNYLSLRDDVPAQGFLAATFRAPKIPWLLLAPGALLLPMLAIRPAARLLRALARRVNAGDSARLTHDVTSWHEYSVEWEHSHARFTVDGAPVFESPVSPRPPLGLILWIDNQYAAFTPAGRIAAGTLANPSPAWVEVEDIRVE